MLTPKLQLGPSWSTSSPIGKGFHGGAAWPMGGWWCWTSGGVKATGEVVREEHAGEEELINGPSGLGSGRRKLIVGPKGGWSRRSLGKSLWRMERMAQWPFRASSRWIVVRRWGSSSAETQVHEYSGSGMLSTRWRLGGRRPGQCAQGLLENQPHRQSNDVEKIKEKQTRGGKVFRIRWILAGWINVKERLNP
jgi:hypothetical protein